jgi:hypothetical protein
VMEEQEQHICLAMSGLENMGAVDGASKG